MPSALPRTRTSSLNNSLNGSTNLSFIFFRRPPTLWWLLMVAEGPLNDTLSITSGYSVPCPRKPTFFNFMASSSNTLINSLPITFRFFSGSSTPLSLLRNLLEASTQISLMWKLFLNTRSTFSASPALSKPLSTNMQVSSLPIARLSRTAVTAESTPPLMPQTTPLLPTFALISFTAVSMNDSIVHLGLHLHI